MRMSQLFVQTLREFPSDAEVISHKLLVETLLYYITKQKINN